MPFLSASGMSPYNKILGGASSGPSTDPNADAWFAAGSVTDPTEKAAVNQFALDLKGTGSTPNNSDVWNSLHWINLVSATSLAASLNDLKGNYNLTAYNSPTWSQNGIKGNGSNMYLLTSYIDANNGSTLDSNSWGCAVRTTQTSPSASFMGVRNASTNPYNAMVESGGSRYYGNNSSFVQDVGAGQFQDGIFINNRTSGTDFKIYFNNVLDFTGAIPTNALASIEMGVLCQNSDGVIAGFSDMEFTVAFEGQGLTANQMEDFNAAINTLNSTIIAGGRNVPSTDADADAYIAAAVISDVTEKAAINQLFLDLKGTGSTTNNTDVYSELTEMYPISPTSISASAVNAVNPSNNDITWYNMAASDLTANGIKGDASAKYGDTGIGLQTITATNSTTVSVSEYPSINGRAIIGSYDGGQSLLDVPYVADTTFFRFYNTKVTTPAIVNKGLSVFTSSLNVTSLDIYENGVSVLAATSSFAPTVSTPNILILAEGRPGGTKTRWSDARVNFAAFGGNLSANKAQDFSDSIIKYLADR